MEILDRHCDDIGRNPADIQRSAVALLFLSDDESFLERMRSAGIERPSIIGGVSEVKDIVAEYQAIGVDELIVPDFTLGSGDQKRATMDTFIGEVAGR